MRGRRYRRTREERRRLKEQVQAVVVLFGSLFVAFSAEAWADLILRGLGL